MSSHPRVRIDLGVPDALAADPRWEIVGELGAGGMGTVYEAIDRRTGERVALKLLGDLGAGLLRFKNEFRLAARLSHPSLVTLYELVQAGDVAWFTMELVDGVELRHWVRGREGICDLARLYRALAQLLDALACLGDAGVVHRDLKPNNVLVSATGALKLLDFGLAGGRDTPDFSAATAAGTPIYMAPEQITDGAPVGPPADLYALGVIVYELLVGEPPFSGGNRTLFRAHRHHTPRGPFASGARVRALGRDGQAELVRVPPGLEWWCLRLLEKRPADRFPDARVARDALAAVETDFQRVLAASAAARRAERATAAARRVATRPTPDSPTALLPVPERPSSIDSGLLAIQPWPPRDAPRNAPPPGREAEWTRLLQMLHAHTADSPARLLLLDGESGVGKSHLAAAFAAEVRRRGAVVLRGACREREAVPYNAFDAAIDEAATLAERIIRRGRLSRAELDAVVADVRLLRPVFPVLRELDQGLTPVGWARRDPTAAGALGEGGAGARARAFDALARLAARVTRERPLVLVIDDLHWADGDSLALLARLLETPGLFVLATAQPGFAPPPTLVAEPRLQRMSLLPLDRRAAARLLVEAGAPALAEDAVLLAHLQSESGGNPYLLLELVRMARAGSDGGRAPRPRLSDVVAHRLAMLDEDERALLELAAVGPQPASGALLQRALGAASRPIALEGHALRRLVQLRLLRESGARAGSLDRVRYEVAHHRLRSALVAEISAERRRVLHLRIAEALEETLTRGTESASSEHSDALAEALVRELRQAGEPVRAAAHAERAAEAAMARLAHARAVELYAVALEQASAADAVRLRIRRGQALAALARFAEASADFGAALESSLVEGLDRTLVELHHASCLMHEGDLDSSERIVERALVRLGATPRRRPVAGLLVLLALLGALAARRVGRALVDAVELVRRRRHRMRQEAPRRSTPRDAARLLAWSLWVPHCQYGGRTLDQLEASLRHRLLAARAATGEEALEAEALAVIPLLPLEHLPGGRRAVERGLARLAARTTQATSARGRAWLPLLRAMRELLAGRPHAALVRFDELARLPLAERGYVALQQRNALLLAGRYDRLLSTSMGGPLADVRAAYVAALRGDDNGAHAGLARAHLVDPARLPWTERSLFVYQQVETLLLLGHVADAVPLARSVHARVRRTAISPLTGAFESLDAIVRALASEARRAEAAGDRSRARRLVAEAAAALARAPIITPPLFRARLLHDRAVLLLVRADVERRPSLRRRALALLDRAEAATRDGHIPCLRLRLCLDLVALLPPERDARRDALLAEARAIAERNRLQLPSLRHPWLPAAAQRALELAVAPEISASIAVVDGTAPTQLDELETRPIPRAP
jgi:serine/threonine protein kinase/tetratricopeptide (TPR) repeat protein